MADSVDSRPHVLFVHLPPRRSRDVRAIAQTSTSRSAQTGFQSVARVTDFAVRSRTAELFIAVSRLVPWILPRVVCERTPVVGRGYASRIAKQVRRSDVDLVIASSSVLVRNWRGRVPAAFWTDAVFGQMVDYYPDFTGLPRWARRVAEAQERQSLSNVKVAAYASTWAAEAALAMRPRARIVVAPRGPGFSSEEIEIALSQRPPAQGPRRLLWVGAEWWRKGGDISVLVARELQSQGRSVTLDLVGDVPSALIGEPNIVVHGPLRKDVPAEREQLLNIFAGADLLIAPSRAECLGVAVIEAAALGVPVVAARTGGLGTMVEDGSFGLVVDQGPGEFERYVRAVSSILDDPKWAAALSAAGRTAVRESYSMDRSAALILEAALREGVSR